MRLIKTLALTTLATATLFACGGDDAGNTPPIDAGPDAGPDAPVAAPLTTVAVVPSYLNRNVDLLFVVDDSGSMAEEQVSLANNFPTMINVLSTIQGGLPDVHIGVVSTNVGSGGVNIGGCSSTAQPNGDDGNLLTNECANLTGQFISDVRLGDGSRSTNYSGDLSTLFGCMARLGISGCGFEQPLESMYRALQPGKNPGFLRDDAHLAIVFLTDEDDCSARAGGELFGDPTGSVTSTLGPRTSFRCYEFGVACANDPNPRAFGSRTGCEPRATSPYVKNVAPYVDFLKALKPDPRQLSIVGIIGNVDGARTAEVVPDPDDGARPALAPSCMSSSGYAFPGFRLQSFLNAFTGHAAVASICNENLTDPLTEVANQIAAAIGSPCLGIDPIDTDLAAAGVQPRCEVEQYLESTPATRTAIPACTVSSGQPCFELTVDAAHCPATSLHLSLSVATSVSPPLHSVREVRCQTAP